MKYENGNEILPTDLLKEVQKYAAGKLLYIPKPDERKSWGELSGYRDKLQKRNILMKNQYKQGATLAQLAEEYYLSIDTVKKIVYRKQDGNLSFESTIESASAYSNQGFLEEWMIIYGMYHDWPMQDEKRKYHYYGVVYLPLRLIHIPNENEYENKIMDGQYEIPLLITFHSNKFWLLNQQMKYHELVQSKRNSYPAIIIIEKEEYHNFMNMYDGLLRMVK